MNTYLGAAQDLSPADIDPAEIAAAGIVYLEGYLWDPKNAKDAFVKAAKIAHDAKRKVALTLSDSFCVDRYRDEFLGLMRNGTVDIVFANEAELHSLYKTSDFDTALKQLRDDVKLGVVTRSEKGCVVVTPTDGRRRAGLPDRRSWWTPPAPAISSPPASCTAWRATCAYKQCGRARRARGGRSDPAHRRAAAGVAEGAGAAARVDGLTSRLPPSLRGA